ncbi:hypothetical protein MMC17_005030 [Xylographa soralifera]|nr:hypothetical protein [Xylographa soralifera]
MADVFTIVGFVLTATCILGLPDQIWLWCGPIGRAWQFCTRWYQHGRAPPDTVPAPPSKEDLDAARAEVDAANIRALTAEGRALVLERNLGDYALYVHELNTKHREATQKLKGDLQQLGRKHQDTINNMNEKHARALRQQNEKHDRALQQLIKKHGRTLQ